MGPDALAVEEGSVRGAEVGDAPAGGELLQHRVQSAHGGIVGEDEIVLLALADGAAVVLELDMGTTAERPHLDCRVHGPSVGACPILMPGSGNAMAELLRERYELLEVVGLTSYFNGFVRMSILLDRC